MYDRASQTQVLSRLLLQYVLTDLHRCSPLCELDLHVLEVLQILQWSSAQVCVCTTSQNRLVYRC